MNIDYMAIVTQAITVLGAGAIFGGYAMQIRKMEEIIKDLKDTLDKINKDYYDIKVELTILKKDIEEINKQLSKLESRNEK